MSILSDGISGLGRFEALHDNAGLRLQGLGSKSRQLKHSAQKPRKPHSNHWFRPFSYINMMDVRAEFWNRSPLNQESPRSLNPKPRILWLNRVCGRSKIFDTTKQTLNPRALNVFTLSQVQARQLPSHSFFLHRLRILTL